MNVKQFNQRSLLIEQAFSVSTAKVMSQILYDNLNCSQFEKTINLSFPLVHYYFCRPML